MSMQSSPGTVAKPGKCTHQQPAMPLHAGSQAGPTIGAACPRSVLASFRRSGPAMFVPSINNGVLPDDVPRIAVVGTQVYVPGGSPQLVTPNSELSFYPGSTGVCYSGTGGADNFRTAQFLIDLGTQFSAPFSVVATRAQN